jgi:hypothetical protein
MSLKPLPQRPGGDEEIGGKLEVGTTVTFLLACIMVSVSLLARTLYGRLGADDLLMLFALMKSLFDSFGVYTLRSSLTFHRYKRWLPPYLTSSP